MLELKDDKGKVIAKLTAVDCNAAGRDEGVWLEIQADDGTKPTLCLVKDKPGGPHNGGWYLGVYRDASKPGTGCDLAVSFCKEHEPMVQVTRGADVQIVSLFDLLERFAATNPK